MAGRVITPFERALTTTVNDIEHIEANSYTTFGIVKIYFHPTANIATANAQVTAIAQTLLKQLPPGETPPLILNYSASTVPIIQLALSGKGLTEQNLADLGLNFVRTRLVTVQGAGIPYPFGGKSPQVMYDLDTGAMQSLGSDRTGCRQCARRSEPSDSGGHRENRRLRVHHQPQQCPVEDLRARRPAHQERATGPWCTCTMWRTCTTAARCRPTSCTSMATARFC